MTRLHPEHLLIAAIVALAWLRFPSVWAAFVTLWPAGR